MISQWDNGIWLFENKMQRHIMTASFPRVYLSIIRGISSTSIEFRNYEVEANFASQYGEPRSEHSKK